MPGRLSWSRRTSDGNKRPFRIEENPDKTPAFIECVYCRSGGGDFELRDAPTFVTLRPCAHTFHTSCALELLERHPSFGILQSACSGCARNKDSPMLLPNHLTQAGFFPLRIDVGIGASWNRPPGQIKPPSSMKLGHTKETDFVRLQERFDQLTLDAVTNGCQLRFYKTLQEDLKRKLHSSKDWMVALSNALELANSQSDHKRVVVQKYLGYIRVLAVEKSGCLPKPVTQECPLFDCIDYERLAGRLDQRNEGTSSELPVVPEASSPGPMHVAVLCVQLLPDTMAALCCGWSIYKVCQHRSSIASAVFNALDWLLHATFVPYVRLFVAVLLIYGMMVLRYASEPHEADDSGFCYTGSVWGFIGPHFITFCKRYLEP